MSAKFTGFIIFCVGLLFLVPALLQFVPMYLYVQKAEFAKGIVSGSVPNQDKLSAPKIRFSTPSGGRFEFTSNVYSKHQYQTGDLLTVFYDKSNPSNAKVYQWSDIWGLPIFFAGLGLPFFLVGIMMLFRSIGQRSHSQVNPPASWR